MARGESQQRRAASARIGIAIGVALVIAAPGCGSSAGASMGRALARAAATVAVAAVAEGAKRRRQRRRGGRRVGNDDSEDWPNEPPGLEVGEPFEVFEYDALIQEERRALPLDRSLAVIDIDPEAITCEVDTECAVLVAGCCSCAQGGGALAVRSDMIEELREQVVDECDEGCPATRPEHVTCTSEPACIHGLCRLIDDRVPEPPVPEPPPG